MANAFTWTGAVSNSGTVGLNWTPSGGPPGPGDTAVENFGTIQFTDAKFNANTLELNAGTLQISNGTGTVAGAAMDANTTLIAGGSGNSALDILGGFLNDGTIEAVGNTLTVAIAADINAGITIAGTLVNAGLITVRDGATLDVTGAAGNIFQGGDVVLHDGTALITAAETGSNYTLDNGSTLGLDSASNGDSVNFSGTADMLRLYSTALDSTININGFASGDTLDIGAETIGSIVYQPLQSGGSGSSSTPFLTILSNTGGTILSDPLTGNRGGQVGNTSGTFVVSTLPDGVVAAGPFEIVTAGNGDTLLEQLPPSTWQWTGVDPSNLNDPLNFDLINGPGNQSDTIITAGTVNGDPTSGDTVIFNDATIAFPLDNTVNGNTIFLTGTSELSFVGSQTGIANGKSGISYNHPTVDQTSLISNDPLPPASTTLNFAGYSVNEGTLISNGGPGSSLTINVTQDGTAPGYFLNYGNIEADTGNSVTIAVAGTSELFNANLIYANGGTVLITASPAGIAGGYAPMLGGVALIGDDGTLVLDTGFPSGTGGSNPVFAFYDGDPGDTLKIDQLAQFGGRILGFQHGDTIDLGEALNVGSIAVTADGRVLLENPGGTVLASLVLSTGAYNTGTFAVSGGIADGFTLTTGSDGNALLTTDVVNSVWNDTSGVWQNAAAWSGSVVPGPTSAAFIGINATGGADGTTSPFVLTTGTSAVDVNSLSEVNSNATLQISSATTVGTSTNLYGIQQIAGEIEVTGGNTLTTTFLKQASPGADLQVDPGGVLALTGHSNLGFANNGTLSEFTVANGTSFANGNTIGLFVIGTATVDGGTIEAGPVLSGTNVVSTGGLISIGQDGGTPSSMTVENGGTVIDTYANLSSDPTSFGSLTLTGSGTTWDDAGDPTDTYNTRGYMHVGNDDQSTNQPSPTPSGTAHLLVESDATLNEATGAQIASSADSAGSATITSGGIWNIGTAATGGGLSVGRGGSGTLVIDGGTVNVLPGTGTGISNGTVYTTDQGVGIGRSAGSYGTVVVSDGGQLNDISLPSTGGMGVGQAGQGLLEVLGLGTVTVAGNTIGVGESVTGVGTIVVGGGTSNALLQTTEGGIVLGQAGTGTLVVVAGGTVALAGGGILVGNSVGAYGFVQVNGGLVTNSSTTAFKGMNVGNAGTGTLDLNSGTVSITGGGITVGNSAAAAGFISVSDGLLASTTGGLTVGNAGTGALDLSGGSIVLAGGIMIGNSAGGSGTVVVTGGTLSSSNGGMNVGNAGTGTLSVNGGTVSVSSGMAIGLSGAASGFATIANGLLTEGAALVVGSAGAGTLDVGSGGTVSAGSGLTIGLTSTGTGAATVNGGTLDDGGIFNVGAGGAGTLIVEGGGLVDQTGINFNVGNGAGGSGTVVVNGGTLKSNGFFGVGGTNASGILLVENSGQVTATNSTGPAADINASGAGAAAATITSNGTWTVDGQLIVGDTGNGALSISTGVVNAGVNVVDIGNQTGGAGIVTVGPGGTLLAGNLTVAAPPSGVSSGILTIATGGTVDTGSLTEGASGTVTINGSLAATAAQGISIGHSGNGPSEMTVNTGGTVSDAGFLTVGAGGVGALVVQSGVVDLTGGSAFVLGLNSGGSGTVTVDGGILNAGSSGISLGSVSGSTGDLTVESGGTLSAAGITTGGGINTGDLGAGAVTVTGSGSHLTALGEMVVGASGSGSLLIENQATAITGAGSLVVGFDVATRAGASGAVTVTGSQSLLGNTGEFVVGDDGLGGLSIQSGATVATAPGTVPTLAAAVIANQSAASGSSVNVTGANSTWQITGTLQVGGAGEGALNIAAGGTVTAAALDAAVQTGSDGVIAVAGAGSLLQLTGSLTVGNQAAGELSILSGATVSALDVTIGNASALSSGNVDVEGPGSELLIGTGGLLNIGLAGGGSGVLTIGTGATLNFNGTIVESGHASFNNNGGVVDPDAIEFTSAANSGAGLNEYSLYVGNINAVQVDAGTGTWDTPMVLTGTSVADATNNIDNNGDTGQWQLSQGGTLIVNANTVDSGQAVVFEDATDTLVIGQVVNGGLPGISGVNPIIAPGAENLLQAGGFAAEIWGYQAGDQILFNNLTVVSDSIVGGNTLDLFGAGDTLLGSLTFFNKGGNKPLSATGMAAAAAQIGAAPCFAAGTRIATERGEVAVEDLVVGDLVTTVLGEAEIGEMWAPIIWIGQRHVTCDRHPRPKQVWPVRVTAGAFGPGRPHTDLFLSPDHAVYVNEVLIPVRHLINDSTIAQVPLDRVAYYHIELPQHEVVLAQGLPTESFLDMKDRSDYANGPGPIRLYPDFSARMWEAFGCARLIVTGAELEAARALIGSYVQVRAVA